MQKVLVTGAGGFLGGWTVESFLLSGVPVRAGIRSWNSAVRLARHSTEMVPCDVLSPEQIDEALDGCDAVVHCAVGNERVTVTGTRNVLAAARRHHLRRVVHLSSVAVYGKSPGVIDETHPRHSRGNRYAQQKIAAEQVAEEYIEQGVPVVMLRPSIIYGPFGEAWTVSFAKRLVSGKWGTMGRRAEGKCNLVYVTDVVQAIYRALHAEDIEGEAFNINGADVITWNEYFTRFNAALGRQPLRPVNTLPIALKAQLLSPVRSAARYALARFGRAVLRLHAKSSSAAKYMKATESLLKLTPTSEQLKLYGVDAEYVIEKAKTKLGYTPRVETAQGLDFCVAWLRQHGLVEG
jgi:nucleoside-diphosphate-sugar epimerase